MGPSVLPVLGRYSLFCLCQAWLVLASGLRADMTWLSHSGSFRCHDIPLEVLSVGKPLQLRTENSMWDSSWSQPPLCHKNEKQMYVLQATENWDLFLLSPKLTNVHPLHSGDPHYLLRLLPKYFTCQPTLLHLWPLDSLCSHSFPSSNFLLLVKLNFEIFPDS